MDIIKELCPELANESWQIALIYLAILAVFYVLMVVAFWKIFTKMGEKGWKSLIPFYNMYILFKRCYNSKKFWQYLIATIIYIVADVVLYIAVKDSILYNCSAIIELIALIWCIVILILLYHNVSKSFGHGAGFTVGLVLLEFIFALILAFGSSEYKGNAYELKSKK